MAPVLSKRFAISMLVYTRHSLPNAHNIETTADEFTRTVQKHMSQDSEKLFSYGTLQIESVQLAAFGRKLDGKPDALIGYRVELIATNDHEFEIRSGATQHRNLRYSGVASDLVEGMVFQLTKEEIEQADTYEPWDYQRVQVELRSGDTAWVYLNSNA